MDKIIAVGELYAERIEKKAMEEMAATAEGMGAQLQAVVWRKAGIPNKLKPSSVDIGLMADGAFAALGPKQTEVRKGSGQWRKLGKLFPILPGRAEANVHAAEGAAEIISKSFQGRNEYLSLQNSGHFFLVATEEDEKARPGLLNNLLAPNFLRSQMALRGQLDIGFEPAMLQKLGWEIRASRRDHGLVVAWLAKRKKPTTGGTTRVSRAKKSFS
eukprot:g21096.t1